MSLTYSLPTRRIKQVVSRLLMVVGAMSLAYHGVLLLTPSLDDNYDVSVAKANRIIALPHMSSTHRVHVIVI